MILIENYAGLVSQHGGDGSWSQAGPDADGTYRHGAERAVLANIHGIWSQGADSPGHDADFRTYPAAPEQSRAMMWLGVITASMFNAVTFQSQQMGAWQSTTTPGGGWLQAIQQDIWAAQVQQLMPSFTAPFGTAHPTASVTSARCLRQSCADPIRARAWREPCNQTSELCVHVIVVNVALDSPVQFGLSIKGLGLTKDANASRLFDASYNATITQGGDMEDFAAPGESLVYEIGCHEPGPHQLSNPTFPEYNDEHQRAPAGTVGVSPWRSCMSRRVLCKEGFVAKAPLNATCSQLSEAVRTTSSSTRPG